MEAIWLELYTVEGKLLLCTVYRKPSNNNFWPDFEDVLHNVKSNSTVKHLIILGDLNADFNTSDGRKLSDLTISFNLTCHVKEPTRITPTSSTCLDQIITNVPLFVKSITVSPRPVSTNDHLTVGVKLKLNVKCEEPYYRHIWLYANGDYDGFKSALHDYNWDVCFESEDIDLVCQNWTMSFLNIARSFIPNKVVLIRPQDKEWYNNTLRRMKRQLNRCYERAKRSVQIHHWEIFKEKQREYQLAIDEAKEKHFKKLNSSLEHARNSKVWWRTVKKVLGKGSDDSYPPILNPLTNLPLTSNKEKAEAFNDFFLSHNHVDDSTSTLPQPLPDNVPCLENLQATEKEVSELLQTLDTNKAMGHDGIS